MISLTLSELNGMVRQALALTFPEDYWVVAEIAEMREASAGHCYLELVEKEDETFARKESFAMKGKNSGAGHFKARAKANIWANVWQRVKGNFEKVTGQSLATGMKVLLKVSVTFHEQYGYSLTVNDIDAAFSMGEMARRRQEIIRQLEEDGVIDLNRQLPLPRPLRRIAVVSSAGAAGYGDFSKQLRESGFHFVTRLFAATMQGGGVEASIIAALNDIAAEAEEWDCVAIIRGGGAVTDLNGFDTYLLAANIAQFPLPVLSGIGHDRDETVVDRVAHTHLKTPTAVAQFIIDGMASEAEHLRQLATRLQLATENRLALHRRRFDAVARRFERAAHQYSHQQHARLLRIFAKMQLATAERLRHLRHRHEALPPLLRQYTENILTGHRQKLSLAQKTLQMAAPERILKLGFSITTDANGRVLHSPNDIAAGAIVYTQLKNGVMSSVKTDAQQESDTLFHKQ